MPTIEYEKTCALCGQAAVLKSFALNTADGLRKFCCAGCLSIYQLLNEYKTTLSIEQTSKINEEI